MLLGVTVGRRAVNTEADTMIRFGKLLEKVKGRAALPGLQVDLLSVANDNFLHDQRLDKFCLAASIGD